MRKYFIFSKQFIMTNLSKAERAKYDLVIGSRRQVYNGTAHHTSGGLTKKKLFYD